jgi:hypothetical protein
MMKRNFPLVLVAAGIVLSAAAFGQIYRSSGEPISKTGVLPAQIAGIDLTTSESGDAAITEFTSMHGKEFPVISGDIGHYGNSAITLWIAGTSTETLAAEMVSSMQARIAEGNSPFTPVNEIQDRKRTVYVLEGMGQEHFYFQSKDLVIWLASDPSHAEGAIQQLLEDYP